MAQPATATGSTTRVRRTPFAVSDPVSRKSALIFESVDNDAHLTARNYSRMLFYLSPLCFFEVTATDLKGLKTGSFWRYNFKMWQHRDYLFDLAAEVLTRQYGSATGGHTFDRANITRLGIQRITLESRPNPWITFDPFGGGTGTIPPDEDVDVFAYVPATPTAQKTAFNNLIKSDGGIPVTVLLEYNVLEVSMETVQWSESDLRSTQAYRDLVSGGGQYVAASQVQNIVREAARRSNLYIFRDPGMENKLSSALDGIFNTQVLPRFADLTRQVDVANLAAAQQIDAELRKGTGFSAEQFKPLVLIWNMIEEIKTETDYKAANERLQKYFRENQSAANASISGFFKGITGALGGSAGRKSIDEGFFRDNTDLRDFKSRYVRGEGQEARIVSMGINLLERGTFENNLSQALGATVVEVVPQGETTPVTTKMQFGSADEVRELENQLLTRIKEGSPAGTVAAYAGEKIPRGWMLCDGKPLKRTADTEALFQAIGTLYGDGIDDATHTKPGDFNLPDYRGFFLRGMATGTASSRDPDKTARRHVQTGQVIGVQLGSFQGAATQMPGNAFTTVAGGAHTHQYKRPHDQGGNQSGSNRVPWVIAAVQFGTTGNPEGNPEGEHTHRIVGGDNETRPSNVYVNWIIKIR